MKNKIFWSLFILSFSSLAFGEEGKSVSLMTDVLGMKGVLIVIGIAVFFYTYANSVKLFSWVDDQTYGKRDYILKKLEIMFIEIEPNKVTIGLIAMSLGLG